MERESRSRGRKVERSSVKGDLKGGRKAEKGRGGSVEKHGVNKEYRTLLNFTVRMRLENEEDVE